MPGEFLFVKKTDVVDIPVLHPLGIFFVFLFPPFFIFLQPVTVTALFSLHLSAVIKPAVLCFNPHSNSPPVICKDFTTCVFEQ